MARIGTTWFTRISGCLLARACRFGRGEGGGREGGREGGEGGREGGREGREGGREGGRDGRGEEGRKVRLSRAVC